MYDVVRPSKLAVSLVIIPAMPRRMVLAVPQVVVPVVDLPHGVDYRGYFSGGWQEGVLYTVVF